MLAKLKKGKLMNYKEIIKNLKHDVKKSKIVSFQGKERDFQKHLQIAFQNMLKQTGYDHEVEILQGPNEKGKDLLIPYKTPFGDYKAAGVVVKVGDVKGSASKDNEIAMQILQCSELEVSYKNTGKPIKLDKIYVVIGGTISNQGKEHILKPIKKLVKKGEISIEIWGMEDVIGFFEKHYPEFFLSESMKSLITSKVEKIKHILKTDKELNYFIEPTLKRRKKTDKIELIKKQTKNSEKEFLQELNEELIGENINFQKFCSSFTSKQKIMIIGEAGSGKSVLLFKAVEQMLLKKINEIEETDLELPVILNAIDFEEKDLKEFNFFKNKIDSFYSNSKVKLNILIIDGIDEVKADKRNKIKQYAEYYQSNEPHVSLVFSSRNNISVVEHFEDYNKYEVLPYEVSKAIDFLRNALLKEKNIIDYLSSKLEELETNFPLYPLSLKLLIKIIKHKKEIPASITELYNNYIEIVLGKYDVTKTPEVDKFFQPHIKEDFFKKLAYHEYFLKNRSKVSIDEFNAFIDDYISKQSIEIDKDKFKESIFRTGLLLEKEEVTFSHKSFLDFFISNYFFNNIMDFIEEERNQLYEIYTNSEWEDVFLFFIGLKKKISKGDLYLLKKHINNQDSDFVKHFHYYFLGKVLQYGWLTDYDLKYEVISESSQYALSLREDFQNLFEQQIGMKIPEFIPSIIVFHLTDLFYSSEFLKKEILTLIKNDLTNKDLDMRRLTFDAFYLANNYEKIESDFLKALMDKLIENIKVLSTKNSEYLKNSIILTLFLKFSSERNNMIEEVKDSINLLIEDFKRKFPDLFRSLITYKKSNYLKEVHKLHSKKRKK